MSRILPGRLIAVSLALAGTSAAAGATGATATSATAADPPPARAILTRFVCERALSPAQREISVRAVMRPVTGTQKLAMRFELLKRTRSGGPVAAVEGRGLNTWVTPSNPTLGTRPNDQWIVDHPVLGLAAPASYHFRVTFRWTGSHGRVLATVQRLSRQCEQPELRPDLLVNSITVRPIPTQPALSQYLASIRNRGDSAAGPFQVVFSPGGSDAVQTRTVAVLRAHRGLQETFVGPACTAATAPTVTVDPNDQVNDLDRSNNSLTATCPAS